MTPAAGNCLQQKTEAVDIATTLILPVRLSVKGQHKEKLPYAMLDSQSDTSFILLSLAEQLGAKIQTLL